MSNFKIYIQSFAICGGNLDVYISVDILCDVANNSEKVMPVVLIQRLENTVSMSYNKLTCAVLVFSV